MMKKLVKRRRLENSNIKKVLHDFLKNTSIHGMKYLNNNSLKSDVINQLFWSCILILASFCSAVMVQRFWNRYHSHPAISVISSFHESTFLTLFPALTVCAVISPKRETRLKLLEEFDLPEGISQTRAADLLKAFEMSHPRGMMNNDREELDEILRINNIELLDLLNMLRTPCKNVVESCWWDQKRQNCNKIFKRSYTFGGLCCSFNYLLEDHVTASYKSTFTTPYKVTTFGANSGLTLVFKENQFIMNHDNGSIARITTNSVGLIVFIHHSMAYPDSSSLILQADREMQLRVSITDFQNLPIKNTANPHPCVVDEKKIEYFPNYGKENCHNSCRMRAAMHLCGCIPWLFAPFAGKNTICGFSRMKCLRENYKDIWSVMYLNKSEIECSCPSPCNRQIYRVSHSQIPISGTIFTPSLIYKNISRKNAVLKIYIAEQVHDSVGDEIIATKIYMLSSIGGIFSLFLGCGILSIAEIIYFLYLLLASCLQTKN